MSPDLLRIAPALYGYESRVRALAADAVITGDAVAELHGDVILGAFNVDREQARDSLRRIAATGAQIAGFGHGEAALADAHVRIRTATDQLRT